MIHGNNRAAVHIMQEPAQEVCLNRPTVNGNNCSACRPGALRSAQRQGSRGQRHCSQCGSWGSNVPGRLGCGWRGIACLMGCQVCIELRRREKLLQKLSLASKPSCFPVFPVREKNRFTVSRGRAPPRVPQMQTDQSVANVKQFARRVFDPFRSACSLAKLACSSVIKCAAKLVLINQLDQIHGTSSGPVLCSRRIFFNSSTSRPPLQSFCYYPSSALISPAFSALRPMQKRTGVQLPISCHLVILNSKEVWSWNPNNSSLWR